MEILAMNEDFTKVNCDCILSYIFSDKLKPTGTLKILDQYLENIVSQLIGEGEIKGKLGETTIIHTYGKIGAKKVIIVGMGEKEKCNLETIRLAAGYGIRTAQKINARIIATEVPNSSDIAASLELVAQAITEGSLLANYKFTKLKTKKNSYSNYAIEKLLLIENEPAKIEKINSGIEIGCIYAWAVNMARDLVNSPANQLTPSAFADKAKEVAVQYGLDIDILSGEKIKEEKMELMYSVGQGSEHPPQLITLKYNSGKENANTIALVGKGLTFDSGGISLKPAERMHEMKNDMAGGAAVLGAMQVIAQLKPQVNVLGIIGAVENMPSGKATKPGDVYKGLAGKTVEIINTDAEGRLVLADAVAYACKLGASTVIDIATLTGACLIALGKNYSALIGNDEKLIKQVIQAGKNSGEKFWCLPNDEEFKELLKSDIADLKNTGGRYAGTITGGLFIGEFISPQVSWVHLDIAGTAWTEKDKSYLVKGATGFGVRTLANLVKTFE
ncbi:MAG TPA: leucyl aminopeptidase [Clostridia bacterium]|jgi:leucyl aminopeptidase|nr:leucyl aminopeptidase [Clostridia bacterium]